MKIEHIEYFLPEKILSNDDLINLNSNWTAKKIENKIGIKKRHIAKKDETVIDLAIGAIELLKKKININSVDALILCTQSPDYILPTSACVIQHKVGMKTDSLCFDFNLGCSGYVYGLGIVKGLLESKQIKNAILCTSETYSKHLDPLDISNRSIFGDAATATFIEHDNDNTKQDVFVYGTDGSGYKDLIVYNKGSRSNPNKSRFLEMNGSEIFKFTNSTIPLVFSNIENKINGDLQFDYCIFHQANKYMLNHLRNKLGIDEKKFIIDMENYGNTVSSTIPIALCNLLKKDDLKNKKIMLVGFGVGLSYSACLIKL